ncbi:MAG: glutamate--tRNA ligase [Candidatus Bathyarchaeia archaeon]
MREESEWPLLTPNTELKETIRKIALLNAVNHEGKAQQGPVIGKLLAEMPQLKGEVKDVASIVAEVVREVNSLSFESQKETVEKTWPEALVREKVEEEKKLPPLPNLGKYKTVVTRFSPNPDAPVHLGSARAIILCHEYAEIYKGKFLVRFEDTDPKLKRPQLPFYDSIKEDLKWLGCEPDEYFIQSDRLPMYYEHAERLLGDGNAYVCTCKSEAFRELILAKKPCPCRSLPPQEHLARWQRMLDGTYNEGAAVVRVKTDLDHPNPAVRDWPALRIIDTDAYPHPRVGNKYRVWPLYNLACGVDDHLMGVTHIIRGKEHLTNQTRQEFMYGHLGWKYPEAIHYGRMKITGASLSKSKIVQGMREGIYKAWDDPRLATFAALRRRGIQAEAIRQLVIDVGPKTQDVTLSWDNLYALNRRIVEPKADRYFFIPEPVKIAVSSLPKPLVAKVPLHPDHPERGFREFHVTPSSGVAGFWVASRDAEKMEKDQVIRFMELFNVRVESLRKGKITAVFHSREYEEARKVKAPLIHWLPEDMDTRCRVVLADASVVEGFVEENCRDLKTGSVVQFERFGFVRIDGVEGGLVTAYYCHR